MNDSKGRKNCPSRLSYQLSFSDANFKNTRSFQILHAVLSSQCRQGSSRFSRGAAGKGFLIISIVWHMLIDRRERCQRTAPSDWSMLRLADSIQLVPFSWCKH